MKSHTELYFSSFVSSLLNSGFSAFFTDKPTIFSEKLALIKTVPDVIFLGSKFLHNYKGYRD